MTRINCISPRELTDLHLLAEYRELPRISMKARHAPDAPSEYKLGIGHVKFFYDKGKYLSKRFEKIVLEMKRRGFQPKFSKYRRHPKGLNKDWRPTKRAKEINRKRIAQRLNEYKIRISKK